MENDCVTPDFLFNAESLHNRDDSSYGSDVDTKNLSELEGDMQYSIVSDPVHKFIWLHPLCRKIIDTPEFQRLRGIKQCGPCEMVYPSATHNRFEHSLGVYHLAGVLLDRLVLNGATVTDTDRLCVQLAGLCHDLGHGPYSHLWENFIFLASRNTWKHEHSSVEVLKHLIQKNKLEYEFIKYGINDKERQFIYNLILGDSNNSDGEKFFLFQIIANSETGIDVDKWDYIMRDGLKFNVSCEFNYNRVLGGIKVVKYKGRHCIAYRDKLAYGILEMFETRAMMHRKCYRHPVSTRVELMLIDALIEADENYNPNYKLSNCHNQVDEFLKLTDHIIFQIAHSSKPELEKSSEILQRIYRRNLYHQLLKFRLNNVSGKDYKEYLQKIKIDLPKQLNEKFCGQNMKFCAEVIKIDFGIDGDPLKNVLFFNKTGTIVHKTIGDMQAKFYTTGISHFKYFEMLLCGKWKKIEFQEKFKDYSEISETVKKILSDVGIEFEVMFDCSQSEVT